MYIHILCTTVGCGPICIIQYAKTRTDICTTYRCYVNKKKSYQNKLVHTMYVSMEYIDFKMNNNKRRDMLLYKLPCIQDKFPF